MTTVPNKIEVAEANPIVFVQRVAEEVRNGFYVTRDIQGYPVQGLPMYITLTESDDEPEITHKLEDDIDTVVVEGWDILQFLLDIQNVVLQGFTVDTQRCVFGDFKSFVLTRRKATLNLKPEVKQEEAPKEEIPKEAPQKRTRKAKGDK